LASPATPFPPPTLKENNRGRQRLKVFGRTTPLVISFCAIRSRVVRYSFTGHFTGSFKNLKGDGREVSFRAVDIYRVQNGQISDNWHLEDNLSLMQQLGAVTP